MSNFMIALLAGAGSGAWVYSKIYRKTGGNSQHSVVVGIAAGVFVLVVMLIILSLLGI